MMNDIQELLDEYVRWLKDKTTFRQLDKWVEITTPYLDRHNDYLQIYAKKDEGKILLTDDGYIIQDLTQNGCKLESKKRRELLQMTLNGFGIQLTKENALMTHATIQNFALQKHNLIQAMLAVNDLFYLSAPIVENLFLEDVMEWLDLHNIRMGGKSRKKNPWDCIQLSKQERNGKTFKEIQALRMKRWEEQCKERMEKGQLSSEIMAMKLA